ncbi:hypothetical protein HPB47_010005 [Ixodes persulcatus]|uniref:Uncharacterized protein n=1 Tax=Ixodes persulcatus TaxID=34615 RepID=A0AC60P0A4_IXOPE|nr:hypothetical protein HPB47_010005 [Ixodes persulcatus]
MAQVIRSPRRGIVPVASHPIRDVGSRAPRARPAAPASAGPPLTQAFQSPRTFSNPESPRNLPRLSSVPTLLSPQRHRRQLGQVVARLSAGDADDYDKVKSSLLKRYRLSAEAFRQRFRNASKKSSEGYSEFASTAMSEPQRRSENQESDGGGPAEVSWLARCLNGATYGIRGQAALRVRQRYCRSGLDGGWRMRHIEGEKTTWVIGQRR